MSDRTGAHKPAKPTRFPPGRSPAGIAAHANNIIHGWPPKLNVRFDSNLLRRKK